MKSWATFYIVNDGYDNLELRFRLPADESHLPISIDFPEVSFLDLQIGRSGVVAMVAMNVGLTHTCCLIAFNHE